MGQVFLAMSAGGRPIAVKVIRTELANDPDFRGRFRREVAAAQKVSGVFSLGSVLTFASTGQGPFGAGSNAALMYRLVNDPADLSDVPGELRSLVGSCLAKHPGDRPTAREVLAEVGALQPAPGWLAESILSSFIQDTPGSAVADPASAGKQVAVTENSAPPARAAQPPRPGPLLHEGTGGPGRHRISRTLASACLTGGLLAGSAAPASAVVYAAVLDAPVVNSAVLDAPVVNSAVVYAAVLDAPVVNSAVVYDAVLDAPDVVSSGSLGLSEHLPVGVTHPGAPPGPECRW